MGFHLLNQVPPSSSVLSCFLPVFYFQLFKSSMTSSCYCCLGLPTVLVPTSFQSNTFVVGLAWFILCIWHSHLILCALMNVTVYAPSVNLSISMLFRTLHILTIQNYQRDALNIIYSSNIITLLYMFRVSSTQDALPTTSPQSVLPIAAYQQDTRTLIESDGTICCSCTTMSSWRWVLDTRNM